MMSAGAMGGGQGGYYVGLATEDYYLSGGEPPGIWIGEGAQRLGLTASGAPVERESFLRLFEGFDPSGNGKGLVQNAGGARRQPGWDLTLSAPKSVSTLWACADPEMRQAIQAAHFAAACEACQFLQDEHAWTRRGKNGTEWERASLVVATFEHGTSRAQDPQLHTHMLVLNLGVREDGTIGSIVSKPFYEARIAAGTLYQVEFAHRMQDLGFTVERTQGAWGNTFEITGVPKALMDLFSTRRQEIETLMETRGETSAKAAAVAALDTREVKQHVARGELFGKWGKDGQALSFTSEEARRLSQSAPKELTPEQTRTTLQSALAAATDRLSENQSHFSERDLLKSVLAEGIGTGLSGSLLRTAVRHEIGKVIPVEQDGNLESREEGDKRDLLYLGEKDGRVRYTTRELFGIEKELLADVDILNGRRDHSKTYSSFGVGEVTLDRAIRASEEKATERARKADPKAEAIRLSEEQRAAVTHITRKTGDIAVLSGMAGTGKTSVLDAAREAWEASGYKVIGVAVAGKAGRELEKGADIESFTVAKLLKELDQGFDYGSSVKLKVVTEFLHATHQINGKTRAKMLGEYHEPTSHLAHEWKYATHQISARQRNFLNMQLDREKFRLDERTVVVVDEAGMLGTRQMAKLLSSITERGAKGVLVGEGRQIQPVEVGGPFEAIGKRIGVAWLTDIIRQALDPTDRNPRWRREVVKDFAEGNATKALSALNERGFLHIADDRKGAMRELIGSWSKQGASVPKENLIFAGTRAEARELNHLAQAERQKAGQLGFRQARINGETIHEKDRVLLTLRDTRLGVENGDLASVKRIDSLRNRLVLTLDRGGEVAIPYKKYDAVTLGYAMTTHKGQGSTVQNAYILCGGSMTDLQLSYVQTSRAKLETRLFTERIHVWDRQQEKRVDRTLDQLAERMGRDRQKDLALDVAQEVARPNYVIR